MITRAPRRPSDRAGRRCRSGEFGRSAGRSWHRGGTLAGLPMGLLLAVSALFVGGLALSGTVAGAATSTPAVTGTVTGDPAWSQIGATASRTWASAGLAVNFAAGGDLTVSSRRDLSANWSLAPSGLGRGQVVPLTGGADAPGAATRTYDNGGLSEWYSATATGLEQGFTLNRRPGGTNGAVTIAMASAGGLTPELTSPNSLSLLGHNGQAELNYSGLKVTDASGRVLPAHLEISGSSIRIVFDDQGATYPVHVDPFIQLASLVPPTNASAFGTVIATSSNGTTALVGDPSGGAAGTGAATGLHLRQRVVVRRHGPFSSGFDRGIRHPRWPCQAPGRRRSSAIPTATRSGRQPSIPTTGPRGRQAPHSPCRPPPVRSAPRWRSPTTVLTALVGDPLGSASSTGAATIFTGGGSSWSAGAALTAPEHLQRPSAPRWRSPATVLPRWSVIRPRAPASHGIVYSYSGTSWGTRNALVQPSHAGAFGTSVALSGSGTTALVGDPTGGAAGTGAATVESFLGGWGVSASLALPSTPAAFGTSVSLDGAGTTALVGDPTGGVGRHGDSQHLHAERHVVVRR